MAALGSQVHAQPVYENNTPTGFSVSDSTSTISFVRDNEVTVQVDLNEPANFDYPVVGNFQKLERSRPFFTTPSEAAYMDQAIEVDGNGIIHRAWIQQRGFANTADITSTPVYGVVYAKSLNGGLTFLDTVSVSGSLRFDMITPNVSMTSGFSTLDLVVDSKGNPRVVYAMNFSADGFRVTPGSTSRNIARLPAGKSLRSHNNIFFNYSNDGGSSWLPANNAVVVNDTNTVGAGTADNGDWEGRHTAFPRMAITSTDDIFVVYERSVNRTFYNTIQSAAVHRPDVMLAKLDADSLKLGSAQPVRIGASGTVGSYGGVRISPDATHEYTPDISIGDDDILHVVWYSSAANTIQHKQLASDDWDDVSSFGWNPIVAGSTVGSFVDEVVVGTAEGIHTAGADDHVRAGMVHLFPTVVVDRTRAPDRVYTFWKSTASVAADDNLAENISYSTSNYNGQAGTGASWSATPLSVFPNTGGPLATGSLFQAGTIYNIESHWQYVDRVAVVVDPRKNNGADLHIAFSGGYSVGAPNLTSRGGTGALANTSIYYTRFNGNEWELPQVVASQSNGSPDGFLSAAYTAANVHSRAHSAVFAPKLVMRDGDDNVYLTFVGGSPTAGGGIDVQNGAVLTDQSGRGYSTGGPANIAPLPYFKIIGRVVTFDDVSIPKGANVYRMSYDPILPQLLVGGNTSLTKNLVTVLAAGNTDGSGIGATAPGASAAPGGFLSGQWMRITGSSLGVTSLAPGTAGAVFKGALSQSQATNDNGVWQGQIDNDGSNGFAEWGDNGDKANLLVKLNVLGSDSATNLYVINASSAAVLETTTASLNTANSISQSVTLGGIVTGALSPRIVQGQTQNQGLAATGVNPAYSLAGLGFASRSLPPLGSYFQMGANISIVADNVAPVVSVTSPDATTATTGFANETFSIRYVLYDDDDDVGTTTAGPNAATGDTLKTELYRYPDNGLASVRDIRTFGVLIVDENDAFTTAGTPGTGDFTESSSASNVQTYSWDDPGVTLQNAFGWAPITKNLDGTFYIYAVADDGSNPPVFDVSDGPMRIRHIPLANSVAPVSVDTVDTGEFDDLDKTNPYTIRYQLIDYDDNAQVRLFFSTVASLSAADVSITGTFPNLTLDLVGATPIQQSDTLRTDEDEEFTFDVTAQGSTQDSVIAQGNYTIYAVVADGDSFAVKASGFALAVRHSPAFEFTAPLSGTVKKINTTQQFNYTFEWQRGRSDQDLDGNARITLYYTGVDPTTFDYSGTDSTRLIATSGANAGNGVLIQGGIREDDEGAGDQFVWDFRDPPNQLPRTYRPPHDGVHNYNPHQYRPVGATTDTAWVYAVLADTLGNTRVASGGGVLLLGSQETPGSQTPRVTMRTPPAGDQKMVNGDVVKLEWDAFLIDDGTGTDDAYLRLYAAPKGKYSTLTQLESNVTGVGGGNDVIIINSLTGSDTTNAHVTTLRESSPNFYNWDTKTTSFGISGTPNEFDIFVGASMDPFRTHSAAPIYVNGQIDSIASGFGSNAQKAVLSKAPGVLRIEGTDPLFSMELSPGSMVASTGDTLDLQVLANSQGSSIDQMGFYLNVPRNYFEVVDLDAGMPGMQPFVDEAGAFQTPSTTAQNDTTQGDAQWMHLNFVETVILGEVIGRVAAPFDSSQVAASLKLVVKNYSGGAPLDTLLQWSIVSGRKTAFRRGTTELAQPPRDATVILTPRARLLVTVPLEGRSDYADTMDAHLRLIGATQDITDQDFIGANDVKQVFTGGGSSTTLEDSVQVLSNSFGTFQLTQIPPGIYELTVKAPGFVTGRSDTLTLFNGKTQAIEPTFGSDALGNLSPATPLGNLRGGDATNDNQVDISDANLIFSIWNAVPADANFVRDADINNDGVINSIDLGFVTKNFGNDGFGAPPVFRTINEGGDNSAAIARMAGIEDVEAWWPGRVFEVTAQVEGMNDVAAYGLRISYDPEKVKPLAAAQAVSQGDVFDENPAGSLFFQRIQPGIIEVASGRVGADWSASGDANLASIRFVALGDDPGVIDIIGGEVVNSAHIGLPVRVDKAQALPMVAALHQNYPNPFNPSTEIRFDIPTARDVKLRIYNQLGQTVRTLVDSRMKAGTYSFEWDGANQTGHGVASGVYFYNLEAGDFRDLRKMTLVK